MSRKRTTYSTELKTKLVLELLKEEKTLVEIAKENNITPNNLKNWKKLFLENAEMAMEPSKVVKEYKNETKKLQEKVDEYAKTVGQLTVENNWMRGKLRSSDLSSKKAMVDFELKSLSVVQQCQLLHISRSSLYYISTISENKLAIKEEIKSIFEEIPIYGAKKVHCQLLENGYNVCLNTVQAYRKELGLRAILAVRDPFSLTKANHEHPKYSYKLKGIDISYANQVWSTDITYIKINGGMVYLAAMIPNYAIEIKNYTLSLQSSGIH